MKGFSEAKLEFLTGEKKLGRIATADSAGRPQVTPVGMWRYNPEVASIDISGYDFTSTRKYRNVANNPQAAFVVDDIASVDPWRPRAVVVEGRAQALADGDGDWGPLIRLWPDRVFSWGLQEPAGRA